VSLDFSLDAVLSFEWRDPSWEVASRFPERVLIAFTNFRTSEGHPQ
jgi:hypothetical protein